MLLPTYVDTLAGPVDQHQNFWGNLTSLGDVEPPEPKYPVLGGNRSIVDLPWCGVAADSATSGSAASAPQPAKHVPHMVFCMYDYALQTVDLYKSLTGVEKIKHASTPRLIRRHFRML